MAKNWRYERWGGLTRLDSAVFVRFHSANHVCQKPRDLWRCFDFKYSLKSQYRYAGRNINPGFYFATADDTSTARRTAIAEMLFYNKELRERCSSDCGISELLSAAPSIGKDLCLVEARGTVTNIRDFTTPSEVVEALRENFPGATEINWDDKHPLSVLAMLIPKDKGGNRGLDILGRYLFDSGISAVLFPSVRALGRPMLSGGEWTLLEIMQKQAWSCDWETWEDIDEIRRECSNIAFFRPGAILSAFQDYRIIYRDGPEEPEFVYNPLSHHRKQEIYAAVASQGGLTKEGEDEVVKKARAKTKSILMPLPISFKECTES